MQLVLQSSLKTRLLVAHFFEKGVTCVLSGLELHISYKNVQLGWKSVVGYTKKN
jgi:hypothetical protein